MGTFKRISGIYEILNTVNNKRYIGHSKSILKRWEGHKYHLRKGNSHHTHLQSAWDVYGEDSFIFSIVEILPDGLPIKEYEIVETKWVEYFKTNLREYGYNAILPGGYILTGEAENKTNLVRGSNVSIITCMCINLITEEKVELKGSKNISDTLGIPQNKISELTQYWKGKGKIKSRNNWLIILEEDFNPEFDYINFKKKRKGSDKEKKTWRDYYNKERYRKSPEDIIPHSERNLKRRSIIAVNILTGEEKEYRMLKDCYNEFKSDKVGICLKHPFGSHQHRGHYFRYNL